MKGKSCKEMARWATSALILCCVFLVMENRSFNHMLGWMKRLNPQIDGVTGQESNPISTTDPNSASLFFKEEAEYVDLDSVHSFQAIRKPIFGSKNTFADLAPMNPFTQQATSLGGANMSQTVMNGFRPEVVPVYNTLVSEFAVFDRWFASVPASTQPNRLYVHSATSHGATKVTHIQVMRVWYLQPNGLFCHD